MKLYIDADGCPVVDQAINIAKSYGVETIIICDTSHEIRRDGATTITVSQGADSVDFKLVNMVSNGDIVITQDYGLSAMCLARQAIPISQDGMIYDDDNINGLLAQRHMAKKIRASGGRLKGNSKRGRAQDIAFADKFTALLSKLTT